MSAWILAILVLSGPAKGDVIELTATPSQAHCNAYAKTFNGMGNGDGPRIEFICIVEGEES